MGFENSYVLWFQSYLSQRQQQVKFKNCISHTINVTSGVPQGSHLGPLLFLIYINDLPDVVDYCNILLYADDVKNFYSFSNDQDCWKLQHDFDQIVRWSEVNGLCLNVKKCKVMTFSRTANFIESTYKLNGQNLERCESFSDLGVLFDRKLSFTPHIENIISKAFSRLGMIKRWAKELNDPYVTKSLYVGLVRSILEFSCQVWNPFYNIHIKRIESVQKQFLLFALKNLNWNDQLRLPPYKHRLLLLNMNTLEDRRKTLSCILVVNIILGRIDSPFLLSLIQFKCPQRNLRNFEPLKEINSTLNYLKHEPYEQYFKFYNNFYFLIDYHVSINITKKHLFNYLKQIM